MGLIAAHHGMVSRVSESLVKFQLKSHTYPNYNDELVWKETTLKRFVQNATNLREMFLDNTNIYVFNKTKLFNQSSSLVTLNLAETGLSGKLKRSLLCLPSMEELDMSFNEFEGQHPELSCSNTTSLRILDLSGCQFQGKIPISFTNFTYLTSLSLSLSNNNLNGSIPSSLSNLQQLIHLDLSSNSFSGQMPSLLSKHVHVNRSNLNFNLVVGDLSESICNLSSLKLLNLAHNQLTDIIPQCLANSSILQVLDLQMNRFYGTLPSNFSEDCVLQTLNLHGNQLEERFPVWLQTLQYLQVLVLQDNKLHGIIPNPKIKHPFPSLIIFYISGNNFSCPLPKAFLKKFEAMKKVTELEYMTNRIRVPYPSVSYTSFLLPHIGKITWYYDSVIVSTKGSKMTLVKIPNIFVIIDLSKNKFEGEIPNAIGDLHALKGLNLSHNRLTGHIPKSMGNLSNLESLDLSSNMLTGMIPAELTNLDFLQVLNLSNNHLVGKIPQEPHFDTFPNDSYKGNLGLCGFPLSKICGPEHHSPISANNSFCSEEKFGFGWKAVAIGYGCGFVIGIGIGYFMFLIGKPRWIVMIFGGQPKRRVKRRTRMRRNHGTTMNQNQNQNQMVQMS
ncbi:receptor-like protein, putative [Medicago truncatula]|uniref:Receptor-like protein, putative n=1 Tax=Medicago truncatula TaxID=3880 RepID=G7KEK2_MEDTR|nr:receptor-like protein, putative [Medicago truncatula]